MDLKKRRLEKWAQAYREWQESGVGQRAYCERKGVRFWQFKAGVEGARRAGILERVNRKGMAGFAPVQVLDTIPNDKTAYWEIRFNGQAGIRIESMESLRNFMTLIGCGGHKAAFVTLQSVWPKKDGVYAGQSNPSSSRTRLAPMDSKSKNSPTVARYMHLVSSL